MIKVVFSEDWLERESFLTPLVDRTQVARTECISLSRNINHTYRSGFIATVTSPYSYADQEWEEEHGQFHPDDKLQVI